ncbi:MAG: hypothetical protein ACF8CQ_17840 [Rhodopirellula sp. JB044]|uniref:hypothetical protein n=1 Tax=Rhodopirellula sp. JB044 TaxID=3342844 RepID=UPI00370A82AA
MTNRPIIQLTDAQKGDKQERAQINDARKESSHESTLEYPQFQELSYQYQPNAFFPAFPMAKCDQGYLCEVCGDEVTSIVESDLYLRYVLGQLDAEKLHLSPERHLRCNPVLSQYIDDERFDPVTVDSDFDKRVLDATFVSQQTERVSKAYRRLWQIAQSETPISLLEYPIDS